MCDLKTVMSSVIQENTPVIPPRKRYLSSTEKVVSISKKSSKNEIPVFKLTEATEDTAVMEKGADNKPQKSEDTLQLILEKLSKLDVIDSKLDAIEGKVQKMEKSLEEYRTSLEFTQGQLSDVCEEVLGLKDKIQDISGLEYQIEMLKVKNAELEQKAIQSEAYSRRENVVVDGLKESVHENSTNVAQELFKQLGLGPFPLQRCHRLGRYNDQQRRPRRMIIRFLNSSDKQSVMENRHKLKGSDTYINDDYPIEIEKKRGALRPVLRYVKQMEDKATLVQDKIRFKGKLYSADSVQQIPINMSGLGIKETDTHVIFAGQFTPLSNFYYCNMECENMKFASSEHLFQFKRSTALGNQDIARRVLSAPTPLDAMIIGREVIADEHWTLTEGVQLMTDVVKLKMAQVPQLAQALKAHAGKTFAEATSNIIWGTGVPLSSPAATNTTQWKGKNLLGIIYQKLSSK